MSRLVYNSMICNTLTKFPCITQPYGYDRTSVLYEHVITIINGHFVTIIYVLVHKRSLYTIFRRTSYISDMLINLYVSKKNDCHGNF